MADNLKDYRKIKNEVLEFVSDESAGCINQLNYTDIKSVSDYISKNRNNNPGFNVKKINFIKQEKDGFGLKGEQRNVLNIEDNSDEGGNSFILSRNYE